MPRAETREIIDRMRQASGTPAVAVDDASEAARVIAGRLIACVVIESRGFDRWRRVRAWPMAATLSRACSAWVAWLTVYRAKDVRHERRVAVRFDSHASRRRSARKGCFGRFALPRACRPGLCSLVHSGRELTVGFSRVMLYIAGDSLRRDERDRTTPIDAALRIAA